MYYVARCATALVYTQNASVCNFFYLCACAQQAVLVGLHPWLHAQVIKLHISF